MSDDLNKNLSKERTACISQILLSFVSIVLPISLKQLLIENPRIFVTIGSNTVYNQKHFNGDDNDDYNSEVGSISS